jgi:hypothetical protein
VPEIVEPEARQARFLRQRSPCRPPAIHVPGWIEARHAIVNHSVTAEGELGNERGEDVAPCHHCHRER